MCKKFFFTAIMCLLILTLKAQSVVSVGCTAAPCSACIAGLAGLWTSSNTTVATVNPSTGYITGVTVGTATISFVYTAPGCGSGVFTSTVNVVPMFTTNGIIEVAPLALAGDEAYTYCASGGLTLVATVFPAITGATYTWNDGTTSTTLTTATFSPTYTPGSTAVTHAYTVTIAQGTCSVTTTVNVVVPPAGCSPCDYYNVNAYRAIEGLTAIPTSTCSDCSTLQTFHTIITGTLTATNTADGNNYYIVNTAYLPKPVYNDDNFFMNSGVILRAFTYNTTLNHCHLFSSKTCPWNGINVRVTGTTAGSLTVNNCLIENVGNNLAGINVVAVGNYYSGTMSPILKSTGTIYNTNYMGININDYTPATSVVSPATPLPFIIQDNVFTLRKLASGLPVGPSSLANYPFSWQSTGILKSITTPSTMDPGFGIDNCTTQTVSWPVGQNGVWLKNVGSNNMLTAATSTIPATYEYNYTIVGSSAPDPTFSYANTNLFDNIGFGVQLSNSNARFYNNTYRHLSQSGVSYSYWTSAGKNDVQVAGIPSDNTNSRYFNCVVGVGSTSGCPYDFTCTNGQFSGTNMATHQGIYMQINGIGNANQYNISNNIMYNLQNGIDFQWYTPLFSGSGPDGYINISNNSIIGKTPALGTEYTAYGIYIDDLGYTYSGIMNGAVNISDNNIQGVDYGIYGVTLGQALKINNNVVNIAPYNITAIGSQIGISCSYARYLQSVSHNIVGGYGFSCSVTGEPTYGIFIDSSGGNSLVPAEISCNSVHDFNVGFEYWFNSNVNWNNNQMMRDKIGIELANHADIGTQGSTATCTPSDNHWDEGTCSFCVTGTCSDWPGWHTGGTSGIYETFVSSYAANPFVIRNGMSTSSPYYTPTYNGAATGYTPYSFGAGTLIDIASSCTSVPPISGCSSYSGFKAAPPAGIKSGIRHDQYTIFPNPSDGNLVITQSAPSASPVTIAVTNTLGQQVYQGALQFENGSASIKLGNVASGFYYVKVSNANGELLNCKIVVDKK